MKVPLYKLDGTSDASVTVDDALFGLPWNPALVHQVVTVAQKNSRVIHASTKTRGEVRGGGKKPWPQKHTGRARHGSIRSPIWVGGGVAFGPRADRNYKRSVNKQMRTKALFTVLSKKLKDGEVFFTADVAFSDAKTKQAAQLFTKFFTAATNDFQSERVLFIGATSPEYQVVKRASRNIPFIRIANVASVSPLLLLGHKYIMLPQSSLTALIALRAKSEVSAVQSHAAHGKQN